MKTAGIIFCFVIVFLTVSCRKNDGIRHNEHKSKPSVVINRENRRNEVRSEKNYNKMMKKRLKNKRKTGNYGVE